MRHVILTLFVFSLFQFGNDYDLVAADEKAALKPLPIKATNSPQELVPGEQGVRVFATRAEFDKAFPNNPWKFDREVDFSKESLIFVEWGTNGPPFGKLTHVVSGKDEIVFSVDEPKVQIRGQAYKIGADWFTVPVGSKVSFKK